MAVIHAKNSLTGVISEIVQNLPRDLRQDLDAGDYFITRPSDEGLVTILAVKNTAAPVLTLASGVFTTTNGTWDGSPVSYVYQWKRDGQIIQGAITNTYIKVPEDEGTSIIAEVAGVDARSRVTAFTPSNSISVPSTIYIITDDEWTSWTAPYYGEDPDDAETRQSYLQLTLLNPLPANTVLHVYKGTNPAGDPSATTAMVGSGLNWTWDGVSPVAVGTVVYMVVYLLNTSNSIKTVASNIRSYTTSNIPGKPNIFTATNSTTISGRVSIDPSNTLPATNNRSIQKWRLFIASLNQYIDLPAVSGDLASTAARDIDFPGTSALSVTIQAYNANGWSVSSDAVTVTPPTITAGVNVVAPTMEANLLGGGRWKCTLGDWTGNITLAGSLEQSDNGTTGWTTNTASITEEGGLWPISTYNGKYFRVKVTPSSGSVAYSNVIGPLVQGYDRVLAHGAPMRYYSQTVSNTLGGMTMAGGIWFSAKCYYNGINWEGHPITIGNSGALYGFYNSVNSAAIRNNSFIAQTSGLGDPASPGWYHITWYYVRTGGTTYSYIFRNDEMASATSSTNPSLTNFTRFCLFHRGDGSSEVYLGGIHDLAFGTGDPTALHAWASEITLDRMKSVYDYDYVTNTNVSLKVFIKAYDFSPTTYDYTTDLVDEMGLLPNSWTSGGPTSDTNTNTGFTSKKPAIVIALAPTPSQPEVYISPAYGTIDVARSLQSGMPAALPPSYTTWNTGTGYAISDRVLVSGTTYRCAISHTSGTWATDLAAGKWVPFVFTLNTLTHTSLGDIKSTVSNGYFTCSTPGVVTAVYTIGGQLPSTPAAWVTNTNYSAGDGTNPGSRVRVTETVNGVSVTNHYECVFSHKAGSSFSSDKSAGNWVFQYGTQAATSEFFDLSPMPANPRLANLFQGNALVCGIEEYPLTPAGTSYDSVASLKADIDTKIGVGGVITVNDLGDYSTGLSLTPGDYLGLVVQAKNVGGVKLDSLSLNGCKNITVRGINAYKYIRAGIAGTSTSYTTGVTIDHCRCSLIEARGINYTSSTLTITNTLGWDREVEAIPAYSGYNKIIAFKRLTFKRSGFGHSQSANVFVTSGIREKIFDRFILMDGFYNGPTHADMYQTVPGSGYDNIFKGFMQNGFIGDYIASGESGNEFQGLFMTDCSFANFYVRRVMTRAAAPNNLLIVKPLINVKIEDCSIGGVSHIGNGVGNSGWVRNCVKSNNSTWIKSSGFTDNCLIASGSPVSMSDVYPDYNVYPRTWRMYRPGVGYENRGAYALFNELEAKRISLGL